MTKLIRAAGGVVIREKKGRLQILLAHRPQYDDWTLPKGKADPGESPEATAVREVREETGLACRIVAPVGTTRYRVDGGAKEVTWFAMRPLPSSRKFEPNDEIDQVRWLDLPRALDTLDYEADRALVEGLDLKGLARTGTIFLVRHAAAGDRDKWSGEDRERPLTKKGRRQAEGLAVRLAAAGIERILTSPYLRCVETVMPLSELTGAAIERSDALGEDPDMDAAYAIVDSLAGHNVVVCSHGDVIPAVMNRMMWAGLTLESHFYCAKGSMWEIGLEAGRFTTARYLPPPV